MINKDNFNESCEIIKDSVKISDYLLENKLIYDVDDKSLIRCLFDDHNDSTASFSYNDDKGLFNCFSCGREGDVINLHYHMKSLDDHNDSKASFSYNDDKGLFNCFGCGRGGDVINLHYHMEKLDDERYSRIKAVKDLSKVFGITIPNMFERRFKRGRVNPYKYHK